MAITDIQADVDRIQGTQTDGTAPYGLPLLVAGNDGTNVRSLLTDTSGRMATAAGTGLPDLAITGNLTAAQPTINTPVAGATSPALLMDGYDTPFLYVSGTFSGTWVVDVSNDGVTWLAGTFLDLSSGTVLSSRTTSGILAIGVLVSRYVRVRCSAYASGTIVAQLWASVGQSGIVSLTSMPISNADGIGPGVGAVTGLSSTSLTPLATAAFGYNGSAWDRLRLPGGKITTTANKGAATATATAAGDTVLWTPATGKKFRVQRLLVQVTAEAAAAAAADLAITLRDGTTDFGYTLSCYVPIASVTTGSPPLLHAWVDAGNGYLSGAANNVLNLNLSFALTAGVVRATAFGTEE